jgi:hypothetical protein
MTEEECELALHTTLIFRKEGAIWERIGAITKSNDSIYSLNVPSHLKLDKFFIADIYPKGAGNKNVTWDYSIVDIKSASISHITDYKCNDFLGKVNPLLNSIQIEGEKNIIFYERHSRIYETDFARYKAHKSLDTIKAFRYNLIT